MGTVASNTKSQFGEKQRSSVERQSHSIRSLTGSEEGPQGRLYKQVMGAATPGSTEVHYEWPDGRSAWIEIDAYPVPDGVAIFYRDISARKLAEEALRELNATLEKRVDERTRELISAEEALRQAQKMEAMGQLTGGVAHDFNNLLTPIVGALDMLQRRGVGGEREQRLISGAVQSAERAKTLVQRLLAFARRQPLQPTAVDIGQAHGGHRRSHRQHLGTSDPGFHRDLREISPSPRPTKISWRWRCSISA
jgi:signal transduction histidine kinase